MRKLSDRVAEAIGCQVDDLPRSLRLLREVRVEALAAGAWANATHAGQTLYSLLAGAGPSHHVEAARIARELSLEQPDAGTLLQLGEAERRVGRASTARRAFRRAVLVARRTGDPDVLRAARAYLEGGPDADGPGIGFPSYVSIRNAESLGGKNAIEAVTRLRNEARRGRAWVVEQACLRRLVILCRSVNRVADECRWAGQLSRRYPTAAAFWLLGTAEQRGGRPARALAALRTARTLALRAGDHDLCGKIDEIEHTVEQD